MSVRVSRGLSREYTPPSDSPESGTFRQRDIQTQRLHTQYAEALNRIADALFMNGVAVTGLPDTASFNGKTDGITFTTGQTRDIQHNLGREAAGFMVIDCRTSAHEIIRETTGLDAQLKKSHIRLTHGGASTTLVKLWVW
jgi:hypothetical protein